MVKLPEFSNNNLKIASYVVSIIVAVAGFFFIYEIIANSGWTIKANWNMFKSAFGNVCMGIGLICAIVFWGKFGHWSRTPVIETRDGSGRLIKREEDFDITEQSFSKIILPVLGHFVIEPIVYGAVIYYPVQCIIALVGVILPYLISLLILAVIAAYVMYTKWYHFRNPSIVLILSGLLFTAAFAWGAYSIKNNTLSYDDAQYSSDRVVADGNEESDENKSDESFEEDENAEQFGISDDSLLATLPEGTSQYTGEMEGFPIEFTIVNDTEKGILRAEYKNVKYTTVMQLEGESMPADDGNIHFYGKDKDQEWVFYLSGNAEDITGTAQSGDKELEIKLHRK